MLSAQDWEEIERIARAVSYGAHSDDLTHHLIACAPDVLADLKPDIRNKWAYLVSALKYEAMDYLSRERGMGMGSARVIRDRGAPSCLSLDAQVSNNEFESDVELYEITPGYGSPLDELLAEEAVVFYVPHHVQDVKKNETSKRWYHRNKVAINERRRARARA